MNCFNFSPQLIKLADQSRQALFDTFRKIDDIVRINQQKVLKAFIDNNISETHLGISTGYGYSDRGRDALERLFAQCVGAEDALIRHNFVSGTHTLTVALFGILRPNDKMLCLTGRPYDTLIGVLGVDGHSDGSLKDFGVEYNQVDLLDDGTPDIEGIKKALERSTYKVAYIQRSRGYSLRPSLTVDEIGQICKTVRSICPDICIMVDNCYGEFVEQAEPCQVGADLIVGSLIKNPGGGIAPTGGYIAGKAKYVEKCAYRLTAPGVGREVGASLGHSRELYMGLFAAPHTVGQALKTASFAAELFSKLGFTVMPKANQYRADIIQSILLGDREKLIAFCEGIQMGSPIDSFAMPEPAPMPGYDNDVIMAAGTFTLGASIELSADAPLREPYAVWLQGGLNFESGEIGVISAAQRMLDKKLIAIID